MRDRLGVLAGVLLAACNAAQDAAPIDLRTRVQRPAISSSSTTNDVAPPPATVPILVEAGEYWRLTSAHGPIHVWIPRGYDPETAQTVVYVHGYFTHVDEAWREHGLAAQFAASAINAMFVACEAPASIAEGVAWRSLPELLATVERGIGRPRPARRIVAVGHSGAFRTLLEWLDEAELKTIVLLDAAYGDIDAYRAWVLASPRHRLIDVAEETQPWTEPLHASLPSSYILDGFPPLEAGIPDEAAAARILYIRSTLGHMPLVTAGIALPMILRVLRAPKLLDIPLAEILAKPAP